MQPFAASRSPKNPSRYIHLSFLAPLAQALSQKKHSVCANKTSHGRCWCVPAHEIQVLKLHEMNVEIKRPKLLAARRLGAALQQRESSLASVEAVSSKAKKAGAARGAGAANFLEAPPLEDDDDGRVEEHHSRNVSPNTGQAKRVHTGTSRGGHLFFIACHSLEPPSDHETKGKSGLVKNNQFDVFCRSRENNSRNIRLRF